ncbi:MULTISPECIES: hypothetical protein [unclassified Lysinibacillus]|uniref:hypothetical protein n=1 Tax=unclassified Lysinibacillus TaxID=2636778 RepID=UPI00381A0501
MNNKPRNFSKYVKKLIEEDMKRGSESEIRIDKNEPVLHEDETYTIETKEAMSSFI